MTEVEKMFHDDIREKKSIKNSANKTNRTGKGPIRFPSDYLSKKEKEKLNGECSTWKYSDFPTREEFNRMPDDIKIGYLNWIYNTYNVGASTISTKVFGQSDSTLTEWLKTHRDIAMYLNFPDKKTRSKRRDIERLCADIAKARAPKQVEPEELTEEEQDYISGYESSNEPKDFTPEEKEFISRYIAPISEPKEKTVVINPEEVVKSTAVVETPKTFDTTLSHMEFGMDGFDMDFLQMIAKRFGDQKIRVNVSVYVEKSMLEDNAPEVGR